jgi:hypothetical protein
VHSTRFKAHLPLSIQKQAASFLPVADFTLTSDSDMNVTALSFATPVSNFHKHLRYAADEFISAQWICSHFVFVGGD